MMLRGLILLCSIVALPVFAHADVCEKREPACILDAAWSAGLILPDSKRMSLAQDFLEIARLARDPELLTHWEKRLGQRISKRSDYSDYGWQKAEPILRSGGVEQLISVARSRQVPLSFGRSDALLSAGKRLYATEPAAAERLNDVLLELSRGASAFETPILAHAAAELAMTRCDMARMRQAVARTDAPQNLRYALWRTRITGNWGDLLNQIRSIENDEDTRDVRRVLAGYRAILELGYCDQSASAIGG
ncbi:MAG: hypothetical protein AAFN91_16110 [Pseudomonadota bacterium]